MTQPMHVGMVLLGLALCVAGCSGSSASSPTSPTVVARATAEAPAQLMRLAGFVVDTGFRPVAGARVEAVEGTHAGTWATTDDRGEFALTGAFDSTIRFRASKDGYVTATQAWSCSVASCGPNAATPWLGFYLAVIAAPVDLSGNYTLTFIADGACPDFPSELRTRAYAARVTPGSTTANIPPDAVFTLDVSGGPFLAGYHDFVIGVAGDHVAFSLDARHNAALVEQVTPTTYLGFSGSAAATVGRSPVSTISASFDGWIDYCVLGSPRDAYESCVPLHPQGNARPVYQTQCDSANHRLMLTRR